jgi:hypothetical protein
MNCKWTGVLIAAVVVPLTLTINVVVEALTDREVPTVINAFALTSAGVAAVAALVAEHHERSVAALKSVIDRFDEVEERIGDYNTGFVAGYLLSIDRDPAAVVSMVPRGTTRREG